jgi:hypothetical protein
MSPWEESGGSKIGSIHFYPIFQNLHDILGLLCRKGNFSHRTLFPFKDEDDPLVFKEIKIRAIFPPDEHEVYAGSPNQTCVHIVKVTGLNIGESDCPLEVPKG